MAETLKIAALDPQQLATPGATVKPHADAVQRQAQQRALHAMLGRHRRQMSMVVLHRMYRQRSPGGEFDREAGAEEVGMQVVRDRLWLDVQQCAQVVYRLDQRAAVLCVVEIADMW